MTTTHIGSRLDFERKAFYTPAEISDLLHVHVSTVRDWIHADRLFAYRLSESGVRRVRDALRPGELAVLTRRTWPLEPAAPYAVRLSGHALLARVLWNERQLLLLPGPGDSDFIVLDAPGRTTLERLLAGRVAATLRAIP